MNPLLSVIVPIYNEEKDLRKCVESILAQTYDNLEIILVDDGSTDTSGAICDEYATNYDNIRVLHCENGGITMARLYGVEIAKGERVTFVDADDWIDKEYYQEACAGNEEFDIIILGEKHGDEIKGYHPIKMSFPEGEYTQEEVLKQLAPSMMWDKEENRAKIPSGLCSKIFKRELLLKEQKRAASLAATFGEDTVVFYPLMLQANKVKIIHKAYYNYNSWINNGEIPGYIRDVDFIDKLCKLYEYLKKRFIELSVIQIMQYQLDCFIGFSIDLKKRQYVPQPHRFDIMFPYQEVEQNSKVVLYGAGIIGQGYMEQNKTHKFCDIVLWVDKNYASIGDARITSPNDIVCCQYDYIVIAIDKDTVVVEIKNWLESIGVPKRKIVWHSIRRQTISNLEQREENI